MTDTAAIAQAYFDSWRSKDFERLRSLFTDDCTFRGPLGQADDADACVAGLKGLLQIVESIDVQHVFADTDDVLTWFELRTTIAPPTPTANWMHIEDGRIARIRVTFDPRGIVAAG